MAKRRTLKAVAIRISMRPAQGQKPDDYARLLRDAFARKKMVRVRGHEVMLLRSLDKREKHALSSAKREITSINGVIAKFTDIDLDGEWFNATTLEIATAADREEISIPPSLKPNHSAFFFEYFPEVHTFAVQTYGTGQALSPSMAKKFFERLFSDLALTLIWGPIGVSLLQHQAALDEMFEMKVLKKLTLTFAPPNADDHAKWEKHFEKKMAAENLDKIEITHHAASGQSITPTEETKNQAAAALQLGEVLAQGRDENGAPKVISSANYPDTEALKYDPDEKSEFQAFIQAAAKLIRRTRF